MQSRAASQLGEGSPNLQLHNVRFWSYKQLNRELWSEMGIKILSSQSREGNFVRQNPLR